MRLAIVVLLALAFAPTSVAREPAGPKKTTILLVGHAKDSHPRGTHEYMPACELLARCLRQTPNVQTVVSQGWPADPNPRGIDALVLYLPWGANALFDGPQRDAVNRLLAGGAGLAAIHWSTGAQGPEFGALWLKQLGGWFHTDFSTIQHLQRHLELVDPAHPVCRGLDAFDLFDEFYFHLRFAEGARPLLQARHDGKPQTVAWTFERPASQGGRSFGCVAGHYHKNLGNDLFRRLLINGILWTAHRDIPSEGAACKIEPADLEPGRAPAAGR
jgi:hypothetical protein